MKTRNFLLYLLYALLMAAFSGCGSNSDNNKSVSALAASKACIDCHAGNSKSISTVTGERITDAWKLSAHNTANGAGCLDCHSKSHYHNIVSENCRGCHVTLSSSHKTGNSCGQCHGASSTAQSDCRTCHIIPHIKPIGDPNNNPDCIKCHNSSIPVDVALKNPDAAGKCFSCHKSKLNSAHFRNMTAGVNAVSSAMYVTRNYEKGCTACHEPHNPLKGRGAAERKAWALSGHGNVYSPAFEDEDFKTNKSCIRCHTSTGYNDFLANSWTTPFPATTWAVAGDKGREVLTCRICHVNYGFAVKSAPAFKAPYNSNKNPKTFPNVGNSNLCIACHSARESGDTILAITTDMSNTSFKNSHYMGAAATMYMSNAFINFTTLTAPVPSNNELTAAGAQAPITFANPPKTYAKNNLPDNVSVPAYGISGGTTSTHRRVGTPDIAGRESYLPAGGIAITTNGPCVTCHLQADNPVAGDTPENKNIPVPAFRPAKGHSLKIDEATAQQLCLPCHGEQHLDGGDGNGNAIYTATVSLATLESAMMKPQSECFQNGLDLLKKILLVKYRINYNGAAHPYFYDLQVDPTGKTAVKDWTRKNVAGTTDAVVTALGATFTPIPAGGFSQIQAKRLMGACFNLNLLVKDPGAYLHARTFSQRLVYDALDYLDNNRMDFTALSSSRALTPSIYKGTNVNVFASNGTLATESMIWMSGTHYSAKQSASPTKGTDLLPMKLHP